MKKIKKFMEKKFELTDEIIEFKGRILHRIRALKDVNYMVKKGSLGGFVQYENNLDQEGKCWIYNNAKVYDKAIVMRDCNINGNAEVFGCALVSDNALIAQNSKVYDHARVYDRAVIGDDTEIYDYAAVTNDSVVYDNAKVHGDAQLYDETVVAENAEVCGFAMVSGYAQITGNAVVTSNKDYIVFKNNFSSNRYFTWTRSNNMWRVGCFYGTGEELVKRAYRESEKKGKSYEAYVELVNKLCEIDKLSSKESYVIITWPEIQDYMEYEGFKENSTLLNSSEDIKQYGSSAYRINKQWKEKMDEELYE